MVGIIDRKLTRKPRRKLGRERKNVHDGLDCLVMLPRNDRLDLLRRITMIVIANLIVSFDVSLIGGSPGKGDKVDDKARDKVWATMIDV